MCSHPIYEAGKLQSVSSSEPWTRWLWRNKNSLLPMCCWVSPFFLSSPLFFYCFPLLPAIIPPCLHRLSASCVHISAILHALVSLNSTSERTLATVDVLPETDESLPVTSLLNHATTQTQGSNNDDVGGQVPKTYMEGHQSTI